jgi:hypothetical protein
LEKTSRKNADIGIITGSIQINYADEIGEAAISLLFISSENRWI